MIFIWSNKAKTKKRTHFRREKHCKNCNLDTWHYLTVLQTWYSVYFIKLFARNTTFYLTCPNCGHNEFISLYNVQQHIPEYFEYEKKNRVSIKSVIVLSLISSLVVILGLFILGVLLRPAHERYITSDRQMEESVTMFGNGQYEDAIELIESSLELGLNSWSESETYAILGEAYFRNGDLDQGIYYYEKAIESDQNNYYALDRLGAIYLYDNKKEKASEYIIKSYELNHEYADINLNRAVISFHNKEYVNASEQCLKAIEYDNTNSYTYYVLAICYAYSNNHSSALEAADKAKELGYDRVEEIESIINNMSSDYY